MSNNDYTSKLAYIKSIEPNHPMITQLDKGSSVVNDILIEKALAQLPAPVSPSEVSDEEKTTEKDPIIKRFRVQIRNQFVQRAKLSDHFHICGSDAERSRISKAIESIQDKIEQLFKDLDHYEQKKELPQLQTTDNYPIPDNPVLLLSKQSSLRSNISIHKKKLRKEAEHGQDPERIKELESHLLHLQTHLRYVENAIQSQAIQ